MSNFKLPAGITLRNASIEKQFSNVKIVVGSDEQIYDKTYVTAIVNNRIVKFLKDSVSYK